MSAEPNATMSSSSCTSYWLSSLSLRSGCKSFIIDPLSILNAKTPYSHVKVFTGELNGFLWLCIAIWSFDRLLRLARVIYFGLIPRFIKGRKAAATYDPSADIIRLDLSALLPNKTINPGEYYYLYAATGIKSYQSHPFTLCSWQRPTTIEGSHSPSLPTSKEDSKTPHPATLPISSSQSTTPPTTNHTLLIRPHTGFTASLKTHLTPSPKAITLLLEGPYGPTLDLTPFSNILFLVAGSGITAAISHLTHLLPLRKPTIHLLWAVPTSRLAENVCSRELAAAVRDPNFRMSVYETRAAGGGSSAGTKDDDGGLEEGEKRGGGRKGPAYALLRGRPDFASAIREARASCVGDRLAVVVCGPARMVDACRGAVVEVLGDEGAGVGVEFYNEAMAW